MSRATYAQRWYALWEKKKSSDEIKWRVGKTETQETEEEGKKRKRRRKEEVNDYDNNDDVEGKNANEANIKNFPFDKTRKIKWKQQNI